MTDKLKPDFEAAMDALSGRSPKQKQSIEAIKFPATVNLVFSCKQCDKGFPLEDGPRTLMSEEHARQVLKEFAKDLEPRTIVCSCEYEAEYYPRDVALSVLPPLEK